MRIAITGAGGRLGAALAKGWTGSHEVLAFPRAALDLGDPEALPAVLAPLEFDALVNCAALTNVDYCETRREEAFRVNAESAGVLGRICAEKGARCIHVSTDYVFGGETPGRRVESDPARPVSVYGESKLRGEDLVLKTSPGHLAVRVSWVFGPERPSFLDMIARRALEHDRAEAIGDKFSSPTYTADCVTWMEALLDPATGGGVMHLCNEGETTWREYGEYGLACLAEAGVPLKTAVVHPLKMAAMTNFVARRPVYTAMSADHFSRKTGLRPRPWREAVAAYVRDYLAAALVSSAASTTRKP